MRRCVRRGADRIVSLSSSLAKHRAFTVLIRSSFPSHPSSSQSKNRTDEITPPTKKKKKKKKKRNCQPWCSGLDSHTSKINHHLLFELKCNRYVCAQSSSTQEDRSRKFHPILQFFTSDRNCTQAISFNNYQCLYFNSRTINFECVGRFNVFVGFFTKHGHHV